MKGIDIYHNEGKNHSYPLKTIPQKAFNESDFVIVKATQGTSYKHEQFFIKTIQAAKKANKLIGAYHYAEGEDPIEEAKFFLERVNKYLGEILLCLDWQYTIGAGKYNKSWGSKTWCTKFIDYIKKQTGITCFLYTGSDGCNHNISLAGKTPLWFAGYPKPMSTNWTIPKWKYNLGKWGKPTIWQYTSSNETIDRNTTSMTKEDWINYTRATKKKKENNMIKVNESNIIICGHGSDTPSLKTLKDYSTKRYNSIASNGKHKGIVAVKRLKALTDSGRDNFHDTYKTILGRNIYSQSLREYVYTKKSGKYYSDCSSSGMATFKKIGYNVSLLNTAGIYQSSLFETVPVKIEKGHIINPQILKVGDCILFVGNDSSRPKQIGHVEYVYEIKNNKPEKIITTTTTKKNNSNKLQPKSSTTFSISGTETPSKKPYKKGKITATSLYFRTWAGKEYQPIKKKPVLFKNTNVNICDAILDKNKKIWYYIQINNIHGFISAKYIN